LIKAFFHIKAVIRLVIVTSKWNNNRPASLDALDEIIKNVVVVIEKNYFGIGKRIGYWFLNTMILNINRDYERGYVQTMDVIATVLNQTYCTVLCHRKFYKQRLKKTRIVLVGVGII
jgi:hypothetical protein